MIARIRVRDVTADLSDALKWTSDAAWLVSYLEAFYPVTELHSPSAPEIGASIVIAAAESIGGDVELLPDRAPPADVADAIY